MTYPDADRYIAATPALLKGWCGQVDWYRRFAPAGAVEWRRGLVGHRWQIVGVDEVVVLDTNAARPDSVDVQIVAIGDIRLDPMRPEVRDHLVRTLALPSWTRDTPGGLEAGVSAGLVACAASGVTPRVILPEWECDESHRARPWERRPDGAYRTWVGVYLNGWEVVIDHAIVARGPETGDAGKLAADTAALAHNCALLDSDALILPFPGQARTWRRP